MIHMTDFDDLLYFIHQYYGDNSWHLDSIFSSSSSVYGLDPLGSCL
jgi:hypothetical protein